MSFFKHLFKKDARPMAAPIPDADQHKWDNDISPNVKGPSREQDFHFAQILSLTPEQAYPEGEDRAAYAEWLKAQ